MYLYQNTTHKEIHMMKEPTTLFSAQISKADLDKFNAIAVHTGTTKAGVLRAWIRRSHKRIETDK